MVTTTQQPDVAQPATEAERPPELPDAAELEGQTRVIIKVERTQPVEAWVIAQEFGGGFAKGKPCDRHRD